MGNEIPVTVASLSDDDLGIKHDESTEDKQPDVEVSLEEKLGPEKDVEESKEQKGGESGHESATKVEILAIWSEEGSSSKASKHGRGDHEGGWDKGWVHHDGHLKERTQTETSQEREAKQHAHAHATVLSIVRSHEEPQSQACAEQREQDPSSLEQGGEQVDVGSSCSSHHGHGQAGVHVLQVGPNIPIKFGVERVEKIINGGCHFDFFLLCSSVAFILNLL